MPTIDFFNVRITLWKAIAGLICLLFGLWIGFAGYSNVQLEPLIKAIIYTFALGVSMAGVYLASYVDYRYFDHQNQQLKRVNGLWFAPQKTFYSYGNMRVVQVRMASATHKTELSERTQTVATQYSAVIKLKDDELYFRGSSNEQETIKYAEQLADMLGIPLKLDLNGLAENRSNDSNASFVRMIFLLLSLLFVLACMYGLAVMTSAG